ncbi:DUF1653 domain-containing protein [Oceanobacter kriegii]|uniref:DUF1653 domain-containing protein n=1 Tax=Oceanobacter kriegii TaxID=64972 RepID=UPI0004079BD0|nr:DUF1653 domain-containing protein [Oceanobacter kriegii]
MTASTEPHTPSIQPGHYRHYKGADYEVFGLVRHSETEEWLVHYRTLYGDYSHWVRPYEMFVEQVVVDGESVDRFAYQGPATNQNDSENAQ